MNENDGKVEETIVINGKKFKFKLRNHMKHDGSRTGYSTAFTKIANFILNSATSIYNDLADPIWYISSGYRICRIERNNPLWALLDNESQMNDRNWLIFQHHPLNSSIIKVTHFGPFGSENNKKYDGEWNGCWRDFQSDAKVVEFRRVLGNNPSEAQTQQAKANLRTHMHGTYIKVKQRLDSDVERAKATLIDIVKVVFGATVDATAITLNLGTALAPSAFKIGGKVLLKETLVTISKQLAKEIAIISSKIAGQESGKVIGKKIPGVGLVIGAGFGLWRACKGDLAGAFGEVASGAVSTLPGVGTAASLAIDGVLACRDVMEALDELKHHQYVLESIESELDKLHDQISELERKHELIMNTFFRDGFNFESNGAQFVEAFFILMNTARLR